MRKLVLLLTACYLTITCFSQELTSSEGLRNLHQVIKLNHVKQESIFHTSFTKDGKVNARELIETITYDSSGKAIEYSGLLALTKLFLKTTNVYDSNNHLLKQVTFNTAKNELYSTTDYWYDTTARIVTMCHYNKDTSHLTGERRAYNKKGQLEALFTRINNNPYYLSQVYDYDDAGDLIQTLAFDNKGKKSYALVYEYDKIKNTKTRYLLNVNGRSKQATFVYNSQRQCISSLRFKENDQSAPEFVQEISYNKDGTLHERITKKDSNLLAIIAHEYTYFK